MSSLQTASLDEIREVAARLCRDYLNGRWKVVTADQLTVKRINGGLSNYLYYISLPEDSSTSAGGASSDMSTAAAAADCADMASGSALDIEDKNRNVPEIEGFEIMGAVSDDSNANIKRQRTDSAGSVFARKVQVQRTEPREVLLRIYGQTHGEDALETMITESVVFALLSERNFGPKLHGIFPGGRIEQYLQARALKTIELSDHRISMKIAEKMGEIHSLNIPISKEPDWLWNCIDRWMKNIDSIFNNNEWSNDAVKGQVEIVRHFDFCEEGKWLKSIIDKGNYPVMFCHNDLQEGNILYRETNDLDSDPQAFQSPRDSLSSLRSNLEDSAIIGMDEISVPESIRSATSTDDTKGTKRKRPQTNNSYNNNNNNNNNGSELTQSSDCDRTCDSLLSNISDEVEPETDLNLSIIDFEYCAYNYRGFDLANHFVEWTLDYTKPDYPFYYFHKHQYPSKEQRKSFILTYLKKLNEGIAGAAEPTDEDVEKIEEEVRLFSLFSHLFWSLWSVVTSISNIEFAYWHYAVARIQEYQLLKKEYLKEENASAVVMDPNDN